MVGRFASVWVLLALVAGAGCSQDGTVEVTWDFLGTEPAASGCGQHGVDSVVISGAEKGGDGVRVVALCTPGIRQISLAPGTWTIQVSMLDFQGNPVTPADPEAPVPLGTAVVTTDAPGVVSVHLSPPAPCGDHVDNDRDGRVDATDPDCAGGTE